MSRRTPDRKPFDRRAFAPLFAALGDGTRLALVATLSDGQPRSIIQLTEGSKLTRQAMTKHIRILEEAGLVRSSKAGRQSLCALETAPIEAARDYLASVSAQWDAALQRLKAFVEE